MMDNLIAALWPVASWLFFASCKGIVVIALVLLCRRLFAPWLSAQARHSLWLAVFACLAFPFGWQVEAQLFTWTSLNAMPSVDGVAVTASPTSEYKAGISPGIEIPAMQTMQTSGRTTDKFRLDVPSDSSRIWLVAAWLSVVIALFGYALWNQIRYFRIRSAAQRVDADVNKLFLNCKAQLDLKPDVQLLESTQVESPAIFGWWSPTLLLPRGLSNQLNQKQLRHVFLHELVHVQRHDILINWLAAMVQIAHWFNPLVWYTVRLLRADMEQACDAKVMSHLSAQERIDYGKTLIKLTDAYPGRMLPAHGVGVVESHSLLKERIKMISQFNPKRIKYSVVAAVMLTAIASVAVTQPRIDSLAKAEQSISGANLATGTSGQQPERSPERFVVRTASLQSVQASPAENPANKISQAESAQRPAAATAARKIEAPMNEKPPAAVQVSANAMAKDSILMGDLVGQVSINTRKKFVVDPRVKGIVVTLVGQRLDQIGYSELLTILRINGCTAFELNGYVNVVPVSDARLMPVPMAIEGKDYPEDQWVSMTLSPTNACATQLVPMLRPLLPREAHMAALASSNSLLVIDTFANLKRIASMVKELDARSTSNGQCGDTRVK